MFLCFGDADADTMAELFDSAGILEGHILEGGLVEDDVGGQFLAGSDTLAQALELDIERFVACSGGASGGGEEVFVLFGRCGIVVVAGDIDAVRLFDELVSGGREFQDTILLNFLLKQVFELGLTEDGLPEKVVVVGATAELLKLVEVISAGICLCVS